MKNSVSLSKYTEEGKSILGYSDDVTSCDCCGKSDLKGTYTVLLNGNINYFGSVCAFKVHAISYEEQKIIKKTHLKRMKSSEKLAKMEAEFNGTDYSLVKMLRFVESRGLDLMAFIKKYGKKFDENDFYIAYSIGHVVKMINK